MLANNYHNVMPKTPYYLSNGTGRDTYISWDNGGSFCPSLKNPGVKRGMMRPSSAVGHSQARSLHYTSDGSGRDSYVKRGDGGLHNISADVSYIDTLRSYQKPTREDNFVNMHSSWVSRRSRSTLRERGKVVAKCISRLYPK